MKKTKRKAFNFLRSYYDVYNKLNNDTDKLKFIELIFNKMFHDIDPDSNLNFSVDLAYESQRHQIEQSVKGYKSKTKDPMQGGCQGSCQDPYVQEEEKEQEEEEEKVEYTIPSFNDFKNYALESSEGLFEIDINELKLKYKSWIENGWKTGGKKPRKIKNWKTTLLNTLKYLKKEKSSDKKEKVLTLAEKMKQDYGIK